MHPAKMSALVAVVVEKENVAPQFTMVHVARGVFVNHVKNLLILLQLKNAILIVSVEMANAVRLAFPFPTSQSHSPCPQDQEFVFPAHREVAPMIGIVERMHAAWRECVPQMD